MQDASPIQPPLDSEEKPSAEEEVEEVTAQAAEDISEALQEASSMEDVQSREAAAMDAVEAASDQARGEEAWAEDDWEDDWEEDEGEKRAIHIELNGRTAVVAAAFAAGATVYVGGKAASTAFRLASLVADEVATKADELTGRKMSAMTEALESAVGSVAGKMLSLLQREGTDEEEDDWDLEDWGESDEW